MSTDQCAQTLFVLVYTKANYPYPAALAARSKHSLGTRMAFRALGISRVAKLSPANFSPGEIYPLPRICAIPLLRTPAHCHRLLVLVVQAEAATTIRVDSRPPSVMAPPSFHSRPPSVMAPPSLHSVSPWLADDTREPSLIAVSNGLISPVRLPANQSVLVRCDCCQ